MRSDLHDRLAHLGEAPPATTPDVDDLVTRGNRRRSHRRLAKAAAGGCAAIMVAASAVAVIPFDRGPSAPQIGPMAGASSSLPDDVADVGPVAHALVNPAATSQLVTRAENVVTQQCMQAQGWKFPVPYAGIGRTPTEADVLASPLTQDEAATYGYGRFWTSPAYTQGGEPVEALNDYLDTLTTAEVADWRTALDGNVGDTGDADNALVIETSSGVALRLGGCRRDGALEVLGDEVFDFHEAFGVQLLQFDTDLTNAEPVEAAITGWAACMSDAGHDFDHPMQAVNAGLDERGSSATPVPSETALAVDDAQCRASSEVAAAYDLAFRDSNQTVIADNIDQISNWLDVREPAVQRSTEIIIETRPEA